VNASGLLVLDDDELSDVFAFFAGEDGFVGVASTAAGPLFVAIVFVVCVFVLFVVCVLVCVGVCVG
jgi:uncharacterized membrane protein YtjA (UPF0391 family)